MTKAIFVNDYQSSRTLVKLYIKLNNCIYCSAQSNFQIYLKMKTVN